jgi:PhoPQ-activated pathogenicity-related protein
MSEKMQEGRRQYLKWLQEDRARRLVKTSEEYEKLPRNIRAAIAKVAEVPNSKLTELDSKQRRALKAAAAQLQKRLLAAYAVLIKADFNE